MPQTVLRHSSNLIMAPLLVKTTRSMKRACLCVEGFDFPSITSRNMGSQISARYVIFTGPGAIKKRTLLDTMKPVDSAFAVDSSRVAHPRSSRLSSRGVPPN